MEDVARVCAVDNEWQRRCLLGLGYYVGEGWEQVAARLNVGALVIAVLIAAGGFVLWLMKRRRY